MSTTTVVDVDTVAVRRSIPRQAPARERREPGSAEVRLTLRGRLTLVVAVLVLAFGALALLGAPAASTGHAHHSAAHLVVVQPGETLWDIASTVAPGQDPRQVVAEIVDLNSLSDPGAIRAGQSLYLPAQ